ncbi:hypothetical protein OROMI_018233 [Orobanche minor]
MEPKIFSLDAITPETKSWTAKVSVLNKTEPRTSSQPTSIRFQNLLLAHNNRTPVKLGFENPLTNNKYQWILGAITAILATDEDTLIFSKLAPTFTHSDHFRDFLGTQTLIGTAAIIIDSHPPRTVTAKGKENTLHEYAAVDELYLTQLHVDIYGFVYTKRGLMCFNSRAMFLGKHKPISAMTPKLSHRLKRCLRSNSQYLPLIEIVISRPISGLRVWR